MLAAQEACYHTLILVAASCICAEALVPQETEDSPTPAIASYKCLRCRKYDILPQYWVQTGINCAAASPCASCVGAQERESTCEG